MIFLALWPSAQAALAVQPSVFYSQASSTVHLTLAFPSASLPKYRDIAPSDFVLYQNLSSDATPTSNIKVLGVFSTSKQVTVLTSVSSTNFNELYTIEILNTRAFTDALGNFPRTVRFSFYLDGTFVSGSENIVTSRSQTTYNGSIEKYPSLENLSTVLSLALVVLVFYILIQKRQTSYLHTYVLSFAQTLYWLTFFAWQTGRNTSFFVGFRYSMLKFFPNFFAMDFAVGLSSNALFTSFMGDNVMIKNCGEYFSLWLLVLLVVLPFYHLMDRYASVSLIFDFNNKIKSALAALFHLTWGNAFFFCFADFYIYCTAKDVPPAPMVSLVFSGIFMLLLALVPFLLLPLRALLSEEDSPLRKQYIIESLEYLKRVFYGFIIISGKQTVLVPIAIPLTEFWLGLALIYLSKDRVFCAAFEVLALITYCLVFAFSNFNSSIVVLGTAALCLGIFYELYLIWGESQVLTRVLRQLRRRPKAHAPADSALFPGASRALLCHRRSNGRDVRQNMTLCIAYSIMRNETAQVQSGDNRCSNCVALAVQCQALLQARLAEYQLKYDNLLQQCQAQLTQAQQAALQQEEEQRDQWQWQLLKARDQHIKLSKALKERNLYISKAQVQIQELVDLNQGLARELEQAKALLEDSRQESTRQQEQMGSLRRQVEELQRKQKRQRGGREKAKAMKGLAHARQETALVGKGLLSLRKEIDQIKQTMLGQVQLVCRTILTSSMAVLDDQHRKRQELLGVIEEQRQVGQAKSKLFQAEREALLQSLQKLKGAKEERESPRKLSEEVDELLRQRERRKEIVRQAIRL